MRKKILLSFGIILVTAAVIFFGFLPGYFHDDTNRVVRDKPVSVSAQAQALHQTLAVADLHNDMLLWGFDIRKRQSGGNADLPRLLEGRVQVQIFTTVTKAGPRAMDPSTGDESLIGLLNFALLEPPSTWFSPYARAIRQADRLKGYAEDSDGKLEVITTRAGFEAFLASHEPGEAVAAVLGTEGMHAAEGSLDKARELHLAGYRVFGMNHFFDNEFAGSSHGVEKGGLTELGRSWVNFVEENGGLIDVAHTSPATIADVIAMATRPVIASHTGARGACDNIRNLSDDSIRGIAATGGVVGIGFWSAAVCERTVPAIVRSIRYVADLVGVRHVSLGSDLEGNIFSPISVDETAQITQALLDEGFSADEIRLIMGDNIIRVLEETLP